jgi:hypothetical protein
LIHWLRKVIDYVYICSQIYINIMLLSKSSLEIKSRKVTQTTLKRKPNLSID